MTGGDPEAIAAAVRGAAGVEAVATRTQADQPMRIGDTKLVGRVVGMPAGGEINQIDLVTGQIPDFTHPGQAVVERHTADTFGLAAGRRVQVFDGTAWHDVTISGVAESPEYLWPARNRQDVLGDPHAFAVLFAPEPLARALSARTRPNQILVEMSGVATQSDRAPRASGRPAVRFISLSMSASATQLSVLPPAVMSVKPISVLRISNHGTTPRSASSIAGIAPTTRWIVRGLVRAT